MLEKALHVLLALLCAAADICPSSRAAAGCHPAAAATKHQEHSFLRANSELSQLIEKKGSLLLRMSKFILANKYL